MDKSIFSRDQVALQNLLRQLRLAAGLRQQDLAQRLCEPQSFVSKYERGERRLDVLELRRVCDELGVPLQEFVRRLEAVL
jgi:transcriptional regulator with XRE-family HTH domain